MGNNNHILENDQKVWQRFLRPQDSNEFDKSETNLNQFDIESF